MICSQCHSKLIEIARYDGDKIVSTRLSCPFCGNGVFDSMRLNEIFSDPDMVYLETGKTRMAVKA